MMRSLPDRFLSGFLARAFLGLLPAALRGGVSAPTEEIAVDCLSQTEFWKRWRLYDELQNRPDIDFFCVKTAAEYYVVNCRDNHISRELFCNGEQGDLKKLESTMKLIEQTSHRRDMLIDVGANVGAICVPAVLRGYFAKAIAIEPHPLNCRLLRTNAALNGIHDRIELFEMAAGSRPNDSIEMELSEDNWGDHRIAVSSEDGIHGEAARKRISVPSNRLDTIVPADRAADALIFIDVQGYEGHVLRGATGLLSAHPPLAIEFWPYGMKRAESFQPLLESVAGYKGFYDLASPDRFRPIGELQALHDEIGESGPHTDILIV